MSHFYFNPFDSSDREHGSIFDVYDAGGYLVGVCATQVEANTLLTIFDAQENKWAI